MGSTEFLEFARKTVLAYACGHIDPTDNHILYMDDVFVVWYCKTLQNHKALLSTTGCTTRSLSMVTRTKRIWTPTKSGRTLS